MIDEREIRESYLIRDDSILIIFFYFGIRNLDTLSTTILHRERKELLNYYVLRLSEENSLVANFDTSSKESLEENNIFLSLTKSQRGKKPTWR